MAEKPGPRPAVLLVLAGTAFFLCFGLGRMTGRPHDPAPVRPARVSAEALAEGFAALAERTYPALVSISVDTGTSFSMSGLMERLRRQFLPEQDTPSRNASGFVVRKDGCIVTSGPALRNARRILVTLADGRRLRARIVDRQADGLAVIKVASATPLPTLPLGRADGLRAGAIVLAAGDPYELEHSFSQGVISAVHRRLEGVQGGALGGQQLLQTDAAVNEGSGGGPLLDASGRVVGVTVAVLSPEGTNSGVGFAIPLDGRRLGFLARALRKA